MAAESVPADDTVTYSYDDLNRLTNASTTAASTTPFNYSYTYDALGNILTKTENGSSTNYTYATNTTAYLNPHAALKIGNSTSTYDNNGNLIGIITGGATTTAYTWDYNNRLTNASSSGVSVSYTYDPWGQRVKQTQGATTTVYSSKFYNITGSTPTKNIFLPDGTLIATVTGTGTTTAVNYAHVDHLGGMNVSTNESGEVSQLIDYLPYGGKRIDEQSGADSAREFIGEFYDENTSLSYLNARYMNSASAKFISQDPMFWGFDQAWLTDPQNQNSYSYARNNPITNLDPTGLYNIKSGQVEGGDTQEGIVNAINSALSLNINWEKVYNISFYNDRFGDKSLNDIVGETLYIGTDITTDITGRLNQLNKERAETAAIMGKGILGNYIPGQAWDVKNTDDPILGGGENGRQYWSYIYNGELIRYDAPGNINFGYVARSLGLPSFFIQGGARAQQIVDNKINDRPGGWRDNSGDSEYIQKGIKAYKATLPWWKRILPW